jgi:hypothetical protein
MTVHFVLLNNNHLSLIHNVNNLSNLFINVADDTILTFFKEINLYTKIELDSIRSKYMFLSF